LQESFVQRYGSAIIETKRGRDLPDLQSRHEGTKGTHLPQEAKMALPEVQAGPNAGAEAAIAVKDPQPLFAWASLSPNWLGRAVTTDTPLVTRTAAKVQP
jgi:hypothetical protein